MGMRTVVEAITGQRTRGTLEVAGTAVPWTDVHRQARLVAGRLAARGVRPGDRVALLGDTDVDLVTAIQATWLAGAAVTVLPQPATDPAHLRRILGDARPRLVLTASPDRLPVADLANLADLAATGPATGPLPDPPDPGDLAILQYTSGSTRAPRGVPVKHAHLAANIDAIRAATDHDRIHRRTVSWLPLYHDMGLVGVLCTMMACGCDLVLVPTAEFAARPLAWLDQLAATRATMTAAPNFAWGLAARLLAATPTLDLSAVRVAVSGGEPIDPTTMTRFLAAAARHGFDPGALVCAYGLAEATLAVTMTRPGTGLRTDVVDPAGLERHSVAVPADGGRPLTRLGRPVAGTRVRIVNDTGEAGERQVGHVEVAGPGVTDGYWGTPPAAPGRWLRTGDLGYLTDGELVVCGRAADLLFAGGRNIHPQDVEALAAEVPRVRAGAAAAFGIPGDGATDRLAVVVESPTWADPAAAEQLRADVRAAVTAGIGLTPRHVAVVPPGGLARTSSGKLRRHEIRSRLLAGTLTAPGRPSDDDSRISIRHP